MKRMKAVNGYAIYEAGARDVEKYGYEVGCFYVFFASDVRDYGIGNSYPEFEGLDSLEAAEACCCGNYAKAREIVEAQTTAASFEEIEKVEKLLDASLIDDDGELIEAEMIPDEAGSSADGLMNALKVRKSEASSRRLPVTLKNVSPPVHINWDAVPDSVMRMLAAALLQDYHARVKREQTERARL